MIRPVDQTTLAHISGETLKKTSADFADMMMKSYQVKQEGKLREMQMQQAQAEMQEFQAGAENRALQRQVDQEKLQFQLETMGSQEAIQKAQLFNEGVQVAGESFSSLVNSQDTFNKWIDMNEGFISEHGGFFGVSIDELRGLEYSPEMKAEMVEAIASAPMDFQRQLLLQDLKNKQSGTGSGKDQFTLPSAATLSTTMQETGTSVQTANAGAMVVQDLVDRSKNGELPIRLSASHATELVKQWAKEIDDATWFYQDPDTSQFLVKQQQFLSDLQSGNADQYVALITSPDITPDLIQKVREDYPNMSAMEVYSQLLERDRARYESKQD